MANSEYILDTTDQQFSDDVITQSDTVPVLVDFWAPWCGPCKMLAPVLEEVANHFAGKVIIAKVNTDENPALGQHFQIRGIPALKLIKNREIVYETGGVQPIATLIEAITPFVNEAPENTIDASTPSVADTVAELQNAMQHSPEAVLEQMTQLVSENPDDVDLNMQFIQTLVAANHLEQAHDHYHGLAQEHKETEFGQQTSIFLDFARAREQAPDVSELEKSIESNPDNLTAIYQLGVNKLLNGETEPAFKDFLHIIKQDAKYEEGLGRRALVAAFTLIDDEELIKTYRQRMANYLH